MEKAKKIIPAELPAGHAREEAKKIVADQLAEQIEHESGDGATFDPSVLEVENEIAQHYNMSLNEFEVMDPVEGYDYLWGRCDYRSHMEIMSRAQRYLGMGVRGYELVSGPKERFPECWDLKAPDGTRRIGDCQLYRVKREVHHAIEVKQALAAKARDLGVSQNVLARAAKYPKYVRATEVQGNPIDYLRNRAQAHGGIPREAFDREMVETLVIHQIAEDAKKGNIHGLPLNRAVPKE